MSAQVWMVLIGAFLFSASISLVQPRERNVWAKSAVCVLSYCGVVLLIWGLK